MTEQFVRFMETKAYATLSQLELELAISLPIFPKTFLRNKIPTFIADMLFKRLLYANFTEIFLKNEKIKYKRFIANLNLLLQNDCIDLSKIDLEEFVIWLKNSQFKYRFQECMILLQTIMLNYEEKK